ncbi:TerC/Alx family metal homeostasis membrane protein [Phaeacidiphilus oryzae]|uniref:TerC/Alx family metal homeostasis membrane protein n=1 Tax=Phaeacidiphilus oryzae TaxID=348818 RepID=UPI000566AA95|nr:TerC/Alx family metal homeostasis membrane protein [Phaeacidiphilus oryzae]
MHVTPALWASTLVVLCALIAVDFLIGGRKPHEVSLREAGTWTVVWIVLALGFGGFVWWHSGSTYAGEFLAGYVTEKALSVDNLFVFVLIMGRFAVPAKDQQRVLMVGVLIALVLRAVFIAAGAAVISAFSWIFFLFGAFLIWTAWKLIREALAERRGGEGPGAGAGEKEEVKENRLVTAMRRRFPSKPLLAVMIAIGTTDVLFAMDSIPAIFGLTQEAYLVFAANAFALMGLRQLYFLIGGLLKRLVHLSYGLSLILGFIGVKLVLHALHESGVHVPEIGIPLSLGVIVVVLVVTTITSLIASRRAEKAS